MGQSSLAWDEATQAHYVGSGPEEDCGGAAGAVGEGEAGKKMK